MIDPQKQQWLHDDEGNPVFADPERRAWSGEIGRRIRDVDGGLVDLIPVQDVIREARERIAAIRRAASAADS
jgi:hypothetical protein